MDAVFVLEVAVGVLADDFQGGVADAGLVVLLDIDELSSEAIDFAPALVETQQHVGPVVGVSSAGAGVDGEVGVVGVLAACQEELQLEAGEFLLELIELGAHLGG